VWLQFCGCIIFSGCPSVTVSVRPSVCMCVRRVSTMSYKPIDGISPNFGWRCSSRDRWTDYVLKVEGSRSRSQQGQTSEWVIAAGGDIHIDTWASKYHLVTPPSKVLWPEAYQFCPVRPYVRSCVRPCARSETLLTWYLAEYSTHYHQTYTNDAICDRHECITIWGQKVKGQGHGGIKYAGNSTFWDC